LRTDTSGDPEFRDLLARVRETDLAAYACQDLPFGRVVEAINPVRHPARHPLYQIALVLNTTDREEYPAGPVVFVPLPAPPATTARCDLVLNFDEQRNEAGEAQHLALRVEFATDLFDADDVRDLSERYLSLLARAVADPTVTLTGLTGSTD